MPQFICRHAGCGATFAADPGALDKFLDHTNRRRQEEAAAGLARHRRHPILPDTASMELWPNPFYRPPNRHEEVSQRLSSIWAPPEDLGCRTLEERVLQLRWVFRWLFGKWVKDALVRNAGTATGKRHRTSTPIAEGTNPEKRAKSDPGREPEMEGAAHELTPALPRGSSATGEPQLQMSTAVRLERFRSLEEEEMSGVIAGQGGIPPPGTASPMPPTKSPGSTKKAKSQMPKKSGASATETFPGEVGPLSKVKRQLPNLPNEGAFDTKFGSARHPRSQAVWERLCKATDMDTGQLKGSVGTPDNSLLTYEEAMRQRDTDRDLLLWVGWISSPPERMSFRRNDLKRTQKG